MKYRLAITTFLFSQPKKWQKLRYDPYRADHVNALWRACTENIRIPHRFVAFTEKPDGVECERRSGFDPIRVPWPDGRWEDGCYPRLRLYDPEVQASLDAEFVLILDLDTVFVGDATALLEKAMEHDFTAYIGSPYRDGSLCSWYNGSFQLCRTGSRPQFWRNFNPETFYGQRQKYRMPGGHRPHGTDQAWLTVCAGPGENTIGGADGAYQWRYLNGVVPGNARVLFFSGREKPWDREVKARNASVAGHWHRYAEAAS